MLSVRPRELRLVIQPLQAVILTISYTYTTEVSALHQTSTLLWNVLNTPDVFNNDYGGPEVQMNPDNSSPR